MGGANSTYEAKDLNELFDKILEEELKAEQMGLHFDGATISKDNHPILITALVRWSK